MSEEIEKKKVGVPTFEEMGATGLDRNGGRIYEDFLLVLQGSQGAQKYIEMADNDGVIGGMLFAIKMLIQSATWTIQPADTEDSSEQQNEENAEFIEQCLDDLDTGFKDYIENFLSFLQHGFSYHEIVYKLRDGYNKDRTKRSKHTDNKIGWSKFPIRSQTSILDARWKFAENGDIEGAFQIPPPTYKERFIPSEKALHFRTTGHKNNPEGRSILRNAYVSYSYKKQVQKIESIGLERDLAGLPVMKVPEEITLPDAPKHMKLAYANARKIVTNIRNDEQGGILMPSRKDPETGEDLYSIELLASGGKKAFDTNKVINRYNLEMLVSVLADFIMLGHEGTGSLALSQDKTKMFTIAIGRWLRAVAEPFNNHGIPELLRLNGWEGPTPTLEFDEIKNVNLVELAEIVNKLSGSGMPLFPDEQAEVEFRQMFGLPEKSDDFEEQQPTENVLDE